MADLRVLFLIVVLTTFGISGLPSILAYSVTIDEPVQGEDVRIILSGVSRNDTVYLQACTILPEYYCFLDEIMAGSGTIRSIEYPFDLGPDQVAGAKFVVQHANGTQVKNPKSFGDGNSVGYVTIDEDSFLVTINRASDEQPGDEVEGFWYHIIGPAAAGPERETISLIGFCTDWRVLLITFGLIFTTLLLIRRWRGQRE